MAIIEVKGLKKNYGELEVLKSIDLEIEEGQVVCIIGPSGSCLLYTSPSPRDSTSSRMPSSA